MKPQKMRRTVILDIPRNVGRGEYAIYTLQWGLVLVGIAGAAGMLLSSLRGDANRTVEALQAAPLWTVADAAASAEPAPMIRLEATLTADTIVSMPDEPEREVLAGAVEISARTSGGGNGSKEAQLHRWEHIPGTLWMTQGDARVRLDVELDSVPRTEPPSFGRPERLTDGGSARLSKTVGFRYLEQDWPLPEAWGEVRSASSRVERWYIPAGGQFVVTGRLVPGEEGAALVVDSANGGGLYAGTFDEIAASSARLGSRLRYGWLPLLLGAGWLLRRVLRIRGDFVRRSNEP